MASATSAASPETLSPTANLAQILNNTSLSSSKREFLLSPEGQRRLRSKARRVFSEQQNEDLDYGMNFSSSEYHNDRFSNFIDDQAQEVDQEEAEAEDNLLNPPEEGFNELQEQVSQEPEFQEQEPELQEQEPHVEENKVENELANLKRLLEEQKHQLAARDLELANSKKALIDFKAAFNVVDKSVNQEREMVYQTYDELLNRLEKHAAAVLLDFERARSAEGLGETHTNVSFYETYKNSTVLNRSEKTAVLYAELFKCLRVLPERINQFRKNLKDICQRNHFDRVMKHLLASKKEYEPDAEAARQQMVEAKIKLKDINSFQKKGSLKRPRVAFG